MTPPSVVPPAGADAISTDRSRRVILGTVSMLGARGFALVASFLAIGVGSRALSRDAFGLWSILSSFAFFGASFDLGLGQGMRYRLAALASRPGQGEEERTLFFAVLYSLTAFAAAAIVLVVALTPVVPWASWLGARYSTIADVVPVVVTVVVALFLLSMPLNLNVAGFLAYQEANRRSAFDVLQSSFLLLAVAAFASRTSLLSFMVAYYGLYDVAGLIGLLFFVHSRGWGWPRVPVARIVASVRPILLSSIRFWLLGLTALLMFSSDPIIAAKVLGLGRAGDFNVVQKLFMVLISIHLTVLTPLWSAYTHAAENDDWAWIERALKRCLAVTALIFGVGVGALLLLSGPILRLWVGRDIGDNGLLLALACWAGIYGIANCYGVVLNGLDQIRRQTALSVGAAVANWPVSLWLGNRFGAKGIVEGTILILLPIVVSNWLQVRSILRRRQTPVVSPTPVPVPTPYEA